MALRERRLNALDALYHCLTDFLRATPPILFALEMISLDEERELNQLSKDITQDLALLTDKNILEWQQATYEVEKLRHHLSDEVWGLFFHIRAFFLRIAHVIKKESLKDPMAPWREDSVILHLLSNVMAKGEIEAALKLKVGALTQIRQSLEAKFIRRIRIESEAL